METFSEIWGDKMPYIKQDRRREIDRMLKGLGTQIFSYGELNYILTKIIHRQISFREKCYDMINSMVGILECCKMELYRMVAAPYENKKRMENGPVSDLDSKSMEDVR